MVKTDNIDQAAPKPDAAAQGKTEKWTEIEHLPGWDEEFYDVYTAKKHGKWTMLKTLKPEFRDNPQMRAMLEKEFEVRYNLAHPHIVMINDLEEVPGLGMCIITDDVYGDSLRKLIDEGKVTEKHIQALQHDLVDALEYIQANHIEHYPIRPETIIFTENIGNLKLIDVGFDQHSSLTPAQAADDIKAYGVVLEAALDAAGDADPRHARLRRIAQRCRAERPAYRDPAALHLALLNRRSDRIYMWIIVFLAAMCILLAWLTSPWAPQYH